MNRQRGIALFTVLVMVLLGTLLVLWSSRSALLGEMLTGNDSDYQRALEAAHAVMRDAESDLRGPGRAIAADANAFDDLQAALAASTPPCSAGLCASGKVPAQFWTTPATLDAMKSVAATYGAHTGAKAPGHPLLPGKAWYWIEVLPYDPRPAITGSAALDLAPDRESPFIYRITVLAEGRKRATQVVIQTSVVWQKNDS
jgi:type IV pilus assembly protein PilX